MVWRSEGVKDTLLGRIYECEREDVRGYGENYILRGFMTRTPHQLLLRVIEGGGGRQAGDVISFGGTEKFE
jgi:hypothetical protein